MLRTLVGTAFLLLFCISAAFAQTGQTISVAAAANLQSVFTNKIIPAFESKSAVTVVPVFGATKGLEQQMENGAPFDVFVSADTDTVAKLAGENLLEAKSIKPYAIGTLVLWARNDAGVRPKSMKDLTNPGILHIAIANPKTAPYGAAAIESLANAKLLDILTPKIVYAENIQQSLQYAVTGNADVTFTALSLVIDRTDGVWWVVPEAFHAPIQQSLGVKVGATPAARLFAAFLTSREANKIWSDSGYRVPKR